MDTSRLSEKICLIAGASQNLGLAFAKRFLEEGATVYLVARRAEIIEEAAAGYERAHALPGDLTDPAFCAEMIETVVREQGRIDVLVNNAYGAPRLPAAEQTDEGWAQALSIGLTAMMAATRAALPHMVDKGSGSIINLGSVNAVHPNFGTAAYATVKAGIEGFTRHVASQYGPDGVRANCLAPGFIVHAQMDAVFDRKPLERRRAQAVIPLRRTGKAAEVAAVAAFLASEDASFITGHTLVVDGGQTIQHGSITTYPIQQALAELGNPDLEKMPV